MSGLEDAQIGDGRRSPSIRQAIGLKARGVLWIEVERRRATDESKDVSRCGLAQRPLLRANPQQVSGASTADAHTRLPTKVWCGGDYSLPANAVLLVWAPAVRRAAPSALRQAGGRGSLETATLHSFTNDWTTSWPHPGTGAERFLSVAHHLHSGRLQTRARPV